MQMRWALRNAEDPDFEAARRDLEIARQWFDWVTEPHLVDEAIFRLRAAELRLSALAHNRRRPGGPDAKGPLATPPMQALAR